MTVTRIAVSAGDPRVVVDLTVGTLAPRLISRDRTSAHVAVAAAGMTLLGGDHVHIDVSVAEGCALEIEDVGGTVAYPGAPSSWTLEARIGAGASLVWRGLPFVVADGADVERRSSIVLGDGATAVIRETLVLGRHGESGGRLTAAFDVDDPLGPVLVEHLRVDGHAPEPGVLGGHRVLDAVIAVGFRPPTGPGDLELEGAGAISRHLAAHTHASPLGRTFESWAGRSILRSPSAPLPFATRPARRRGVSATSG